MQWRDHVQDPRRQKAARARIQVEAGVREFFSARGFVETRTPLLVPCPGMEIHIRPVELKDGRYLPTSPEFAMKRLLVGGLERIFQIAPAFRHEPVSSTHLPEFTMLEWYQAGLKLEGLMAQVEGMFNHLCVKLRGDSVCSFDGQKISMASPWPRLRIRDLFTAIGIDLVKDDLRSHCERMGLKPAARDTWDDLYFRIWLNRIEPELPKRTPVIVYDYPSSQSALAEVAVDPDGSRWARRFEVYAGGLELGNAFQELTDPVEQRRRFVADMKERDAIYGADFPASPIDEGFLEALEQGLPPSSGIAMGLDRIIMLLSDEPDIEKTFWIPRL